MTFEEAARIAQSDILAEYPHCDICGGLIDDQPQTTPDWVYDAARNICEGNHLNTYYCPKCKQTFVSTKTTIPICACEE